MTISQDASATQSDLVKQLLACPDCFHHATHDTTYIETHISHLLLVGDYVYKIKKPVNLGFLDFSTLERRRRCCLEELRLNRRLAPELYLGLVTIGGTPQQPQLNAAGVVIEYAVQMRRFEQRALLNETLPDQSELGTLARQIADFHHSIPAAPKGSAWGSPALVLQPMDENFQQIRDLKHPLLESERLARLQNWTDNFMIGASPLLEERREAGRIRECHGDLHLGNITRFQGRLTPFDGIEFNPALRWIDTLSDLAFLLMDLHHRGLGSFAARLLNDYLEQSGDYTGLPLLPFYLLYRAMVRAKVCAIRYTQSDIGKEEADAVLDEYRRYLNLAESVTSNPPVALLLTQGVSGSGKSHIGGWLAEQLMAIRIRSDVERKRLFPEEDAQGLARRYSAEATLTTYAHLLGMARRLLRAGFAVIVDATFLKQSQRQPFLELAAALETSFLILACQVSEPVLEQRIVRRAAAGGDPSEADLCVMRNQLKQQEPLSERECRYVIQLDSETFPPAGMMATVLQRLMRQGSESEQSGQINEA
jgi:aminoglycoside phosphotransferase family enzyme/gluconate kinase